MDSSIGQSTDSGGRPRSAETRHRLLRAATELIAELGWGRVTTRAIAHKAGLPHGAVSYHFQGKEELLAEAALQAVERMFPLSEMQRLETMDDLTSMIRERVAGRDSIDPIGGAVLIEAIRESGHNAALRDRLTALMQDYRRVTAELVSNGQNRGTVASWITPSSLATMIVATGDGLLLHALFDPELDVAGAAETLVELLRAGTKP